MNNSFQQGFQKGFKKGLDILSFNRLTAPQILEGGADISIKPRGFWHVSILKPDGSIQAPFGDHLIENMVLGNMKNALLTNTSGYFNNIPQNLWGNGSYLSTTTAVLGNSQTAVSITQTGMPSALKVSSSIYPSGNTITMDSSTGNIAYTAKYLFSTEAASNTYYDVGINNVNSGGTWSTYFSPNSSVPWVRALFPSPVTTNVGDQVLLTYTLIVPTLAVTPASITLTSQNGFSVAGQLKCVGTTAAIAGGTVTAGGTVSADTTCPLLLNPGVTNNFGLTNASAFPAFNSNTTAMSTNAVAGNWSTYTAGSYIRDITATWGTAVSVATVNSITLSQTGVNGYQLLLSSAQTKATGYTLNFGLRFSL